VGRAVGSADGLCVGAEEGVAVGRPVGRIDGSGDGTCDGSAVVAVAAIKEEVRIIMVRRQRFLHMAGGD
jgi:hypothetical protein